MQFKLLEAIQLGFVAPHYGLPDWPHAHQVHRLFDTTNKLLKKHFDKFDDHYKELRTNLGFSSDDELDFRPNRKAAVTKYYPELNAAPVVDSVVVTAENIHKVRVVFIDNISKKKVSAEDEDEYDSVAFMLWPPFVFDEGLD